MMPLYLHSADATPCDYPNDCARDHFIPTVAQLTQMAATLASVHDYAHKCAVMRMEPSTQGLRDVLRPETR